MTVEAQQHMIFGAMCMDADFRNRLANAPQGSLPKDYYDSIERVIGDYASTNDVVVEPSVVQNVVNVLRGDSPCRSASLSAFAQAKASACPCWPC